MFSWNFAKSAEEMFSRLAVKRVCKFLLKKKLGDFILGDIDLDQLDVQLRDGTIRLSDLALNLDSINSKLSAAASVIIKEGSIGSLLVQLPLKSKTCELEVDELELLLAPCPKNDQNDGDKSHQDVEFFSHNDQRKPNHNAFDNTSKPPPGDVHEGVRTIANLVKCLLTSFHVRIKKLIVAFEPYPEVEEKSPRETLVLRVSEIECGTCISEDADLHSDGVESCLGISRLTNYVKFHGGIIELLQINDFGDQRKASSVPGTAFSDLFSSYNPSHFTTLILSGKDGGISGNLTLSIPLKNGSLDITTVDANICIEPLEVKLRPSTVKWLLLSWDNIKDMNNENGGQFADSIYLNATSQWQSSKYESDVVGNDRMTSLGGSNSVKFSPLRGKKPASEALLPESHIISDWVPFHFNKNENDLNGGGMDLGASMDQFFECFDGLRNSQSALGSSGLWNWTSSVFTAITAASNLASGSLHVPSEQQHVKTNLKATISGISITFLFHDEDKNHLCDLGDGGKYIGPEFSHLGAECSDMLLILQVCPQELNFEGKVKSIEIANYISAEDGLGHSVNTQDPSIEQLQAEVHGSLPNYKFCTDIYSNVSTGCPNVQGHEVIKVVLVKTSGTFTCQMTLCLTKSDGCFTGPRSFSLELPPFIFWLDFCLVKKLLDLANEVTGSVEVKNQMNKNPSETFNAKQSSDDGNATEGCGPILTTLSATEKLQGCVTITSARVLLCFPFETRQNLNSFWDRFIAIDFSSAPTTNRPMTQDASSISRKHFGKRFSSITSMLQLNFGNVDVHLVSSISNDPCEIACGVQRPTFNAQKIFSVTNNAKCLSHISMSWQEGPVTGPWVAKKAKCLATSEEPWSRNKYAKKDYEFATATAMNDLDDSSAQIRKEIILSSASFLHMRLSSVSISLTSSDYKIINGLLKQIIDGLSSGTHSETNVGEGFTAFQTSVQVECDAVEILLFPDIKENIRSSFQTELPGSWHHLKLKIQKFDLLSVSNIGGHKGANYLWLAHGEGNLWGSTTEVLGQEFLLISCRNSAMKRGDGGGSNALSFKFAGTDIVHLWEPENLHGFTSVTVRCGTIHAVGGRLDWLEKIANFFSMPSGTEEQSNSSSGEDDSNLHSGASFVLNLVDIGLSYEPYVSDLVTSRVLECNSSFSNQKVGTSEPHVACLLAASSFNLSNTSVPHSDGEEYKIRVQDLGLLICQVSRPDESLGGVCDAKNLHKMGYTKVARESLVEVTLRTNSINGLVWDVECSRSHIFVETCHDTTSGLIRLAAQLQQLFAPDLEESVVHLQTRWNNFQQAQERADLYEEPISPISSNSPSSSDMKSKPEAISLMDEICHDAYNLNGNLADGTNSYESELHMAIDEGFFVVPCKSSTKGPEKSSEDIYLSGSTPAATGGSSRNSLSEKHFIPEVIEGYCLSEVCPPLTLPAVNETYSEIFDQKSTAAREGNIGKRDCGWYGDIPLKILENHIMDVCEQNSPKQSVEEELISIDHKGSIDFAKVVGRVLLKDINIRWRMYGGSDWGHKVISGQTSKEIHGRNISACMEIVLSGLNFIYDVFPLGGVPASKLCVSVQDFYLYDNSKDAPWKLALGYYHSKSRPRETYSKAFKLELEAVRPDPNSPLEEYRLGISFLPLVLHLHQSQLDFFIGFFGTRSSEVNHYTGHYQDSGASTSLPTDNVKNTRYTISEEALLPYFQKVDIWPTTIHVDYQPHRVDLAALGGGKYVELVNLVPWKGVELHLKHVHATGIYGWGSVCETIIGEWLEDISQNQIHKVLRGLPTIRSLVAVGNSAAKLVSLPYENYRKDQKVVKGMQRGTIAFLRSISVEAIGLGVHLAAGAHEILLQAEYILASIQPSVQRPVQRRNKSSIRSNHPKNAQQGIQQACESLSDGLDKSASALVRNPLKKYQRGAGTASALATAVRAVPTATIAPVSACASAVHSALVGLRNSLDPESKKVSLEKYIGPSTPQSRYNDAEE